MIRYTHCNCFHISPQFLADLDARGRSDNRKMGQRSVWVIFVCL